MGAASLDMTPATPATADLASVSTGTPDADVTTTARVGATGFRREVFGFLPYWELHDRSTVLDWRSLSTVAYFSVGCTASGGLWKRNLDGSVSTGWAGWTSSKMTSVINHAHANGARVVLAVSCFAWTRSGASVQASLLRSPSRRARLARQVAAAVRDRGADGVNLDFEPILAGYAEEFTALVRAVRRELNAIAPGYQLTFDAGATIGNQPIAAATAPGAADAVLIMGYDYRTESSSIAGSISPLSGPGYDLTDTVKAFTSRTSPSKVILGVPYYGRAWSTPSDDLHARTRNPAKYGGVAEPHYHHAAALAAAYGRRYDRVEEAPWAAYRREYCTRAYGCVSTWRQLYYDDAKSLGLRYDLVNRSGLRGVGIWALGYDGASPELRAVLRDKFRGDRAGPLVALEKLPERAGQPRFRVTWSARDASRIRRFDVQVSTNGKPFEPFVTGSTATSATFPGRPGRTYAFRVRAVDSHGNASPWTSAGSTSVPRSLAVGGFGRVIVDGLKLRSSPTTLATIEKVLHAGDALQVVGGPVVRQGYTWFRVRGPVRRWGPLGDGGLRGWVAAHGNGVTHLVPRRPIYATRVPVP
jgi:spore germination protein YaaH